MGDSNSLIDSSEAPRNPKLPVEPLLLTSVKLPSSSRGDLGELKARKLFDFVSRLGVVGVGPVEVVISGSLLWGVSSDCRRVW